MAAASHRQLALIADLSEERVLDDEAAVLVEALTKLIATGTEVSGGFASTIITKMFDLPRLDGQEVASVRSTPAAGFYRKDDTVYQVRISKSGHWYASYAELPTPGSGRTHMRWHYIGHRVRLAGAELLDEATAAAFLGFCVSCGARECEHRELVSA